MGCIHSGRISGNKIGLDLLHYLCLIKIDLQNRWYQNKYEAFADSCIKKLAAKTEQDNEKLGSNPMFRFSDGSLYFHILQHRIHLYI